MELERTRGKTSSIKMGARSYKAMGKSGQGRPRHRWADILIAGAGKLWSREAEDRKKWKELEKEQLKMLN